MVDQRKSRKVYKALKETKPTNYPILLLKITKLN